MKTIRNILTAAGIASLAALAACSSGKYKIEGSVEGADPDAFIALERADANGGWLLLDSVKLDDGKFSFSGEPTGAPEIFRLRMGADYIYLPVDSTETVTVNTTARGFAHDFSLQGSDDARHMEAFEKQLIAFSPYATNADSLDSFKRRVYSEFLKDARGSVVSYYILTKTIGGRALYEHADDYRYFAAVATSFRQYRPDDPRTALLEQVASEGLRKHNTAKGKQRVVQAEEIDFIDMELPDENGAAVKLSAIAGKGQLTVIVFANMTAEGSPGMHMKMRQLASRAAIYEVAFDEDRFAWREGAKNLPWTTVWAGDVTNGSQTAQKYNLQRVPAFFIIDASGHLIDRADSYEELMRKI